MQEHYYSSLLKRQKKQFDGNLDIKDVTDNRELWKTSKSLFSDKTKSSITILLEKDKAVTGNSEIATTLNSCFTNVVKLLEIPESENIDQLYEQIKTSTLKAIVKFRKQQVKKAINDSFANRSFSFSSIEKKDVLLKILKENVDFFSNYICLFSLKLLVHLNSHLP